MAEANISLLRRRLLHWYDKNKRDLPWRHSRDPYAIWISETMLQQTQVKTVLPYYGHFLATFPTVQDLAHATLHDVLRLWSGLGYYRRAENLHKAARQIERQYGGSLPRAYNQLRALPGIGEYTAGALLSIAFGQNYPAVDGNARRVLGRLFHAKINLEIQTYAAKLVDTIQPGNLNQALMELGATICTANAPRCGDCPMAAPCLSRGQLGQAVRPRALKFHNVTWPLAIVHRRGKIVLRHRQADGLLAKLWELPGGEIESTTKPEVGIKKQLRPLLIASLAPQLLAVLRHNITNRRIHAPVLLYRWPKNKPAPQSKPEWRWIEPTELHRYAVSSITSKAVKLFLNHEKNFT